jgi:hypothetical protein
MQISFEVQDIPADLLCDGLHYGRLANEEVGKAVANIIKKELISADQPYFPSAEPGLDDDDDATGAIPWIRAIKYKDVAKVHRERDLKKLC